MADESKGKTTASGAPATEPLGLFASTPGLLQRELEDLFGPKPNWGLRVRPGKAGLGLRLGELNVGPYAEIAEVSDNRSLRARGALLRPGQRPPNQGYNVVCKTDVWSANVSDLYEEAIQRRWAPATDIAWAEITGGPRDLELAVCQICTTLSSFSSALCTAVGKHLQWISYEFHEVKCFLATQCFDHARHVEAFRKRALVNGGGLLVPPGFAYKPMLEERDWVGASTEIHLVVESFLRSFVEACEYAAPRRADKMIFGLVLQDLTRHIQYGMGRAAYMVERNPERRDEIKAYLGNSERWILDEYFGAPTWEALALLLGGGVEGYERGVEQLQGVRRKMVRDYARRLECLGLSDYLRPEGLARGMQPRLRAYLA